MDKWDIAMIFLNAIPGVANKYVGMILSGDQNLMIVGILGAIGLAYMLVKMARVWIKAIIHTQF